MCGIAGKVDFAGAVSPTVIRRMCAVMEHRGPDSHGTFVENGVGLGTQRLAIIDIAGGDQPIFNEDGTVAVVANGEIYNFVDLRKRLIRRGHRFTSRSDTEVLVHLYEDHGKEMVQHLRGMFAFAIWDERRRRLFCARDRVGKKPLFWVRQGECVLFASEVRALLEDPAVRREIDYSALVAYLAFRYVPHPLSAFKGIRKLPPACTLTVTETDEHVERYWSIDYTRKLHAPVAELEEILWARLREATRIRLVAEVPIGAFLSGGVDSSAVVAAMAEQMCEPVKTFSIGFADPRFDELRYARLVAERFGTDHHEFLVEPHALEIMPKLARHYGEPFADPAAIPSFYLAELTGRHVTVALNGDGGDESFGGYDHYLGAHEPRHLGWLPHAVRAAAPAVARTLGPGKAHSSARTKIQRLARMLAMPTEARYAASVSTFDEVQRDRLLTPQFAAAVEAFRPEEFLTRAWRRANAANLLDHMLATDLETYLPGALLAKMDIATMAYSVEARSPFLDHELVEFAASLPAELKIDGSGTKRLLKSTLRAVLPAEILERPKMGFGVPLARWFREELRALPGEVLLDPRSIGRGYFRRSEIESLIREHQERVADHSLRLWSLLQLEMWHREVLERPPIPDPSLEQSA